MENKEIGAILKRAREDSGFDRETVADMVGKSPKTIGHWETGHVSVDANTLFALCRIYGIDMNTAFGFANTTDPVAPEESLTADMEELLRTLTPQQAALLCKIAARWLEHVKTTAKL